MSGNSNTSVAIVGIDIGKNSFHIMWVESNRNEPVRQKARILPGGQALLRPKPVERTSVRQRKTGRPVRFELTEQTRQYRTRCPQSNIWSI